MKSIITPLMLFLSLFLHQSANAYSQGISLSVKDAPLDKVFSIIQKQTKYILVYVHQQMKGTKKVTVQVTNERIQKVLDLVLGDQPLSYSIEDNYVVIGPKIKSNSLLDNNENVSGAPIELTGRVTNEKGEPVVGATVMVKGTYIITTTGSDGYFTIKSVDNKSILTITSVGYEPKIVKITSSRIEIKLTVSAQIIKEVIVKGSTGYQIIDKSHPGSFDVVDNTLLQRSVSPDIINRVKNLTPGVSFDNPGDGLLIRGRNSIHSNVNPLIVVDNFPYDGNINNINPNDVENVTILKDAAAAAQWGAKAGNGVIVITTKKGKTNKPQISVNSVFTYQQKPNLKREKRIASAEYIELEKWLFEKGFYDGDINMTINPPPLTPVIETLNKLRNKELSESEANKIIEGFGSIDVRDDFDKYFYKNSLSQQTSVNVSGNTNVLNYYLSAGWDRTPSNLRGQINDRITLRSQNIFKITKDLSITTGLSYVQNNQKNTGNLGISFNSGAGKQIYPYADLVGENGEALSIVKDFRAIYADTVGSGQLLDWKFRPLNEIKSSLNESNNRDFLINTGIKYEFAKFLNTEVNYQYENALNSNSLLNKVESYSMRDMINRYYQPDSYIKFPVPIGGLMNVNNSELVSHQGRFQINFNQDFSFDHKINAFFGYEMKSLTVRSISYLLYGYSDEGSVVNPNMDFVTLFPQYGNPNVSLTIPNSQSVSKGFDRFISAYGNLLYRFRDKYSFSASMRNDAANLFGVKTNLKGVPLWSIGGSWEISKEKFFKSDFLTFAKFRITYGHNGNFSRAASAYTTANYGTNFLGLRYATIRTAPNENLRWEQVRTFNLGFDFEIKKRVLFGSIEYYSKDNKDLMGEAPIDPTFGIGESFFGNVARSKGKGVELNLNTSNDFGKISWQANFLFSYAINKVTEYNYQVTKSPIFFLGAVGNINPIVGKPIYTLYSLPWGGLDPENGDPLGYLGKDKSKDYLTMLQKSNSDSLVYHGPAQPPYFGAFRNTITWNNLSLSFNISYRMGYYFRRNSIAYNSLFNSWTGHSDYSKRWMKQGDELRTSVPSLVYTDYPQFTNRDQFYQYSSELVEKGDNIRLEDININYTIDKFRSKLLPFKQVRLYAYFGNLNVLIWKANKAGIDPLFPNGNTMRKSVSLGVNIIL